MHDTCTKIDFFTPQIQEVLIELEKTQNEFWNIDRDCANFLHMLIKLHKSKNALELGTSNGYSGIWLASALKQNGGALTTIEFWDKRQCLAIDNFKKCGLDGIITTKLGSACVILKEMQDEIAQNEDKMFDFVFVDANKLEYLKYFELIHPILKRGGVMLCDNVISHAEKVKPFMDIILYHRDYHSQMLPFSAGLVMSVKKD